MANFKEVLRVDGLIGEQEEVIVLVLEVELANMEITGALMVAMATRIIGGVEVNQITKIMEIMEITRMEDNKEIIKIINKIIKAKHQVTQIDSEQMALELVAIKTKVAKNYSQSQMN